MAETRDAALVRNAIAIMESLENCVLGQMSSRDYLTFLSNPSGAFLHFDDATRARVWAAIQRRLPEHLRETEETV